MNKKKNWFRPGGWIHKFWRMTFGRLYYLCGYNTAFSIYSQNLNIIPKTILTAVCFPVRLNKKNRPLPTVTASITLEKSRSPLQKLVDCAYGIFPDKYVLISGYSAAPTQETLNKTKNHQCSVWSTLIINTQSYKYTHFCKLGAQFLQL